MEKTHWCMDGDGGDAGGMDVPSGAGMDRMDGAAADSETSPSSAEMLKSMGYNVDGGGGMDRTDGGTTGSETSGLVTKALMVLLGCSFALFLLMFLLG